MKYMLLIYNDPEQQPDYGTEAFDAMMQGFFAANDKMKADGVLVDGESLTEPKTATSVRVKEGKTETMDGPFAETREYLGGYYIVDVPNLDAAISYAELIPSTKWGTVEVRALMDYNPAGN
ncbi:MAG: YciI family protein [Shimia sp.]|uniref:YciI family protein n=1 Tax=Shimia sp. TaxID=1954381 RepID=UPI003B8D4DB8